MMGRRNQRLFFLSALNEHRFPDYAAFRKGRLGLRDRDE
jgi:hypothetical protein